MRLDQSKPSAGLEQPPKLRAFVVAELFEIAGVESGHSWISKLESSRTISSGLIA